MKPTLCKLRLLLAFVLSIFGPTPVRADRLNTNLSTDWKFLHDDADPSTATDQWELISVPHTWNNLDAQKGKLGNPDLKFGYFRGTCWYARQIDAPPTWQHKRIFIRFEAASIVAQVFLNGKSVGQHRGAFTAFCFELTPYLNLGQHNELRVRVDNAPQDDVPPLSGDFNMDGGLYRPVSLIVTDKICVSPLDFASPGVFITTPKIDSGHATVEIKSLIDNGTKSTSSPKVEITIADATGKIVAQKTESPTVAAGKTDTIQDELDIPNPHLWNGRTDPYLYAVTVCTYNGNEIADQVTQPLGVRTVAITPGQGFLLNGKPYPIHGVCRHQDSFNKGWALLPADHQRDADLILAMGTTAVRNTHYPQSEFWHDLADHNGLLMWDESSLVNTIADTPEFTANSELEAREMILQLYNHPSIAFWGISNELGNTKGMPDPTALLNKMKSLEKELDSSRLIVSAIDHLDKPYNTIPDWPCYNAYPGWYGGAPSSLSETIDKFAKEVGKPFAMSEYGAGANPAQHEEGPITWRGGKIANNNPIHPEEYQAAIHEADYAQMANNPNVWGTFLWVMFDFPAAPRHEGGTIGLNDKGMITQNRQTKKDAYFFYQANWTIDPMVHITAKQMALRHQPTTEIKVYSNCPAVDLKVNGQPIAAVQPDNVHVFRWPNIPLNIGENQIEVTATNNGKTVTDHCTWVREAAATSQP